MKFKKIAALSTAVIMSASMLVGCGNNKSKENTDKSFKIGMVADIGGINHLTKVHGKVFKRLKKILE